MQIAEAILISGSGFNYSSGYKHLPPGHIKIREATEMVKQTYDKPKKIEKFFNRRIRFKSKTPHQWLQLCDQICIEIGSPKIANLVLNSKIAHGFGGIYRKNTIHFPDRNICYSILIHELTHHVTKDEDHGEQFCLDLIMLFLVAYEIITGRTPKPDWECKAKNLMTN